MAGSKLSRERICSSSKDCKGSNQRCVRVGARGESRTRGSWCPRENLHRCHRNPSHDGWTFRVGCICKLGIAFGCRIHWETKLRGFTVHGNNSHSRMWPQFRSITPWVALRKDVPNACATHVCRRINTPCCEDYPNEIGHMHTSPLYTYLSLHTYMYM